MEQQNDRPREEIRSGSYPASEAAVESSDRLLRALVQVRELERQVRNSSTQRRVNRGRSTLFKRQLHVQWYRVLRKLSGCLVARKLTAYDRMYPTTSSSPTHTGNCVTNSSRRGLLGITTTAIRGMTYIPSTARYDPRHHSIRHCLRLFTQRHQCGAPRAELARLGPALPAGQAVW